MDELERSALGNQPYTPPETRFAEEPGEAFAHGDRVGTLDRNGNLVKVEGQQDTPQGIQKPATTPDDGGYLRQADYTRKTQALAEERRSLDNERARLLELQNRMLEGQAGRQTPQAQRPDILDRLPKSVKDQLDGQSSQVLETIGLMVNDLVGEQFNTMRSEQQQALNQSLTPIVQQLRAQTVAREYDQLEATLGRDKLSPHMDQIARTLVQNPQMNAAQAVNAVAPSIMMEHYMELGRKQAVDQFKQQQDADLYGGAPGPSSQGTPQLVPGESMRDSVQKLMGQTRDPAARSAMRAYLEQE